ncbi:MAG: metalloregulator ArsR/SmtB family transcription factor [Bacteroidota bacterium]
MRLKNFSLSIGSQIFKACSDESRLRILNLIFQNKEMCISDLEQILDFTQTKTSRHLIYLKNSGILVTRKIDQWVFYSLKEEVLEIIGQIFQFLSKDQILKQDAEIFKTMYSNRELALNKFEHKNWQP